MQQEIDLNVLKIIHTLTNTKSVTKAAEALNVSPGSISYALNKARNLTRHHLFIRKSTGMQPDSMALELSERYLKIINAGRKSVEQPPVEKRMMMTERMNSLMEVMAAQLILNGEYNYQVLHSCAPYTGDINERVDDLKNKKVNMDVGSMLPPDPQIRHVKLFSSRTSIVVRKDHPYQDSGVTLEEWQSAKHAVWSTLSDYYCDNMLIASESLKHMEDRNAVMTSSSNINMVAFCSTNDCMMLMPDFYIPAMMQVFPVTRLATPPEIDLKYDCYMHIHADLTQDRAMMVQIDEIIRDFNAFADKMFCRDNGIIAWH